MTRTEVADKLRQSTRSLDRLRSSDPDFPKPLAFTVSGTRQKMIWDANDIDTWLFHKRGPAAVLPELDHYFKTRRGTPQGGRPPRR